MSEISERIAGWAASQPEAVALRTDAASLSFAELDGRATRLANYLAGLGVGDGATVAICLPRSFDQIVAALATMRAGAAYVPLDPAWPIERVRTILADSGAAVFVAPRALAAAAGAAAIGLCPVEDAAAIVGASGEYVEHGQGPESLAYVVYTSGSTGVPKGAEITHVNLSHLMAWHTPTFGVMPGDRASHLAGLGFDGAVWEVWPYLAAGVSVCLVDDVARTSPALLQEWMVKQRITCAFIPTSLAEAMMTMEWPAETALRHVQTGGDTLHARPKEGLPFTVWNCYGPTECTVNASSGIVYPAREGGVEARPTIGRAMSRASIYVLDEAGEPVPVGETGELWIGGGGVGRGYRNLPELTAKCFVPDRFSEVPGARMYRTGDLAAFRADGEIEFHGRADGQVKIRGQRLELDEIISVLNRHPAVVFNAVVALGEGAEKRLVAYVLPVEGALPGADELQEFLSASLPSYMVPFTYVRVEAIPLNANGKLDRAKLPLPSAENLLPARARRGPSSPVEQTVLEIVQNLLKTTEVGVDDDFFLMGGHSLMGTQLVMRVRASFGVQVTLRDLFECGTAAQLAERVETMLIAEMDAMTDEEAASQMADDAAPRFADHAEHRTAA